MYDVIVLGAGPAGISASLYSKRAGKNTLVLYSGNSSLEKAEKIDNYYGFINGISGKELYRQGIEQAKNLDIDVKKEEVLKIEMQIDKSQEINTNIPNHSDRISTESQNSNERENKKSTMPSSNKQNADIYFTVTTNNEKYNTRAIIIGVGQKKQKLEVKGVSEFEGKGVSYCAICDGFFYKNKDVVVIGSGDYAISETNDLINLAHSVTILTNGDKAPDIRADNVHVITKNIKEISGENRVNSVIFQDDSVMATEGVFIAQGDDGPRAIAKKLGLILDGNKIVVDEKMQTNIKGIFACGDCTNGLLQVCKAVYDGAKAGLEAVNYLKK